MNVIYKNKIIRNILIERNDVRIITNVKNIKKMANFKALDYF